MSTDSPKSRPAAELANAVQFLTLERGIIRARWIFVPMAIALLTALISSILIGREHRPEMVQYSAGLYLCGGFFIYAYTRAWRAGNIIWRYMALLVATLFLGTLAFVHADDAAAWRVYSLSGIRDRPSEPRLFIPTVANLTALLLLWVHGFFLGLGSHISKVLTTGATRILPSLPETESPEPKGEREEEFNPETCEESSEEADPEAPATPPASPPSASPPAEPGL